ncbi:unnamed protein product [Durusdinium trenchii]|uniref:Uncharacterized protein n=1 Tax=Durusdinium trenchii TaxID=1381693 RepID=A0ABP0RKK1_9DINO
MSVRKGWLALAVVCLVWNSLRFNQTDAFLSPRGLRQRECTKVQASSGTTFATSPVVPAIREALKEGGCLNQWFDSATAVANACGLQTDEAETILAKGFGWSTWLAVNRAAYLKPENPDSAKISEGLDYFTSGPLKLTKEELRYVLQESPKALNRPAAAYQDALATAPEEFQSPEAFRELLLRCPMVLELSFNCGHSCAAACARCWCPALSRIKRTELKKESGLQTR